MGETRIDLGGRTDGGCLGRGSSPAGPRSRVQVGSAAEHSRFERVGEEQAAGDAHARSVVPKRTLAKMGSVAVRWRMVVASSQP
ncbi:MAG TPA: hypothetical protein VKI44_16780 [Acetobacteraceae bacterium]|nr:hypothetical protein [Acetobacteraceae bacterium]